MKLVIFPDAALFTCPQKEISAAEPSYRPAFQALPYIALSKMGLRSTIVVCSTSFLLGIYSLLEYTQSSSATGSLFTHWIADSLTLWKSPVTDEHLWTAALYYSILAKGPPIIFYFLAAVVALGAVTILWSLGDGEAGNLMFDGGSICQSILPPAAADSPFQSVLFATTVVLYLYSVIPSPCPLTFLYASYSPPAVIVAKFSTLPTHQLKDPFPGSLRSATLGLASNHLMCSVALTGVLILQAGRFWAERSDDADVAELRREAALLKGRQSRAKTPDAKS
jgi:hypothetical protein